MREIWTNPNSGRTAIVMTLVSIVVGVLWFAYLNAVSRPPDIMRLVPAIWFITALLGFVYGLRAIAFNVHRLLGVLSMLLNIANIPLAGIFLLAAMMGD